MQGHAVVTGAGGLLGRAIVRRLDQAGMSVALVGRRRAPLVSAAQGCTQPTRILPADVRDPTQVGRVAEELVAAWARVDLLVNCAALLADPQEQRVDPWTYFGCVLRTNVLGPALVTDTLAPLFRRGSLVVHIGSSMACLPTPHAMAYGASKAALEHLTASQAAALGPKGVRVVTVAPGPLHERPVDGIAPIDAVAEAIVYLRSRYGAHHHGSVIRIDRGEVIRAGSRSR